MRKYFSCFSISSVLQNFVQVYVSANFGFNGHKSPNYLGAFAGLMFLNWFQIKKLSPNATFTRIVNCKF